MLRSSGVLLSLLLSALLTASPVSTDMLPDGWTFKGQPRVFTGNDLYGYINGGSELFLEFGFDQLTAYQIRTPDGDLGLDLYEMTDPVAALGIYLAKCSPESPVPGLDARNSGDAYQLALLKGRWFAFIQNVSGDRDRIPDMKRLAEEVNRNLDGAVPPFPVKIPGSGLVNGSLRLARGPYALQPVFTLGDGNLLLLGAETPAAIADYQQDGSAWTLIRVVYPDALTARKGFDSLVRHLDPYLEPVEQTDSTLVFRDYADRYGVAKQNDANLDIRLHLERIPQ